MNFNKNILLLTTIFFCLLNYSEEASIKEEKLNPLSFRELLHMTHEANGKGIFLSDNHRAFGERVYFVLPIPLSLNPRYSTELLAAADFAALTINQQGGLNGKRLEIIRLDDMGKVNKALALLTRAIKDYPIKAIIGPMTTDRTLSAAKNIAIPNSIPLMSPSASANAISDLEDNGWVFQIFPNNAQQSEKLSNFIIENEKITKVIMIGNESIYSQELQDDISKRLKVNNINVTKTFSLNTLVDYKTFGLNKIIKNIQKLNPQLLIITVNQDQNVELIKQINKHWRGKLPILLFSDSAREIDIIQENASRNNSCMFIVSAKQNKSNPLIGQIASLLEKNITISNSTYLYDAIVLMAMSYAISDKYNLDIRKVMLKITDHGKQWNSEQFKSMIDGFQQDTSYSYMGQSGPVKLNSMGNNVTSQLLIKKLIPEQKCDLIQP